MLRRNLRVLAVAFSGLAVQAMARSDRPRYQERKGQFPGMTAKRTLRVELAGPNRNTGIAEGTANVKTAVYSGQQIEVPFAAQ